MDPGLRLAHDAPTQLDRVDSFILPFYTRVFDALRSATLFSLVCRTRMVRSAYYHPFVDGWVMGHAAMAVATAMVAFRLPKEVQFVLTFYAAWRLFELLVLHVQYLVLDEYRAIRDGLRVNPLNYRRLLVHLAHNWIEIVFWFAALYSVHWSLFTGAGKSVPLPWGSLYLSLVTMATIGFGDITPSSGRGAALVAVQIGFGVFLALAVVTRWVGLAKARPREDTIK
jgi:hypothetical protein